MKNKYAMLIIDGQIDFTDPEGALFVPGADEDMKRLANWMLLNKKQIDHIVLTIDSHPVNDISHPAFWQDKKGKHPDPFTPITLADINEGKWIPRFYPKEAIEYVKTLESQKEFGHLIWPYHCLTGSKGAAINESLMGAVKDWSLDGKYYQTITKGTYPLTEHFGIFRANVPVADRPETQLNQGLIDTLERYQHIILAGEAKSHCVANSLRQAMDEAPSLAQKFIILEDCMSDVSNMGHFGTPIYERARQLGIQFTNTTDLVL